MPTGIPQTSFTGGEFSPALYGRIDLAKYYIGLRTCRNFIVRPYGGVVNRPGWKYIGPVDNHAYAHRLIPFQFSNVQSYALIFGNYTMTVVMNGGVVVYSSGVNAGLPVTVTTIYPSSELRNLTFTQSADTITICHPSYPTQQLTRTAHDAWNFSSFPHVNGPFDAINIDKTKTVRVSATTGAVTVTASVGIFTSDMVGKMLYVEQSPDSMTKKWEVSKATTINDIIRAGANYYQALASGTTGTVRPDHLEGSGYDGNPGVPWLYLHSGNGIISITGFTSATVVTGTVLKQIPGTLVTASTSKDINTLAPGTPIRVTVNAHGYTNGESITVSGVLGTVGANGTWQIVVVDANNFDLSGSSDATAYTSGGTTTEALAAQPSYRWAFESWGGSYLYPRCVSYYQQRQIFGGSSGYPQNIWMSRTKGFTDFGTSSPLLDDDAITVQIASREVNEIRHFVEIGELIALSSSGPWLIRGGNGNNAAITPGTISVKSQGKGGISLAPPLVIGSQALYIQEKGQRIRALGYSFANDQFATTDLTITASHLFENHTIVEWAYQAVPFSCVWAVRDDGVLLGLTYMPEQDVVAWHRHDTDGLVESVACVSENGTEDAVYLIVNRTINGVTKRYIERANNRQFTILSDAFFVDCGLAYNGAAATNFSGLDHLEGKTVSILADGNVIAPQIVTNGAITLPNAASKVAVGLPITSDLETLSVSAPSGNIRDRQKLINHVSIVLDGSSGISVGEDANNLFEYPQRQYEPYDTSTSLAADMIDVRISAHWNKGGRVFVRQANPLPISVLSIIPELSVGGV